MINGQRTLHVDPGDDIVLASDGYPFLEPTLDQSERALAELKASDPHLISRFPHDQRLRTRARLLRRPRIPALHRLNPRTHKLKRLR